MKIITLLMLMFVSLNISASEKCNKIVPGFEAKDTMYVICKDLSFLSSSDATDLIMHLYNQYKGPPDETLIYFVTSADSVGISNLKGDELSGYYYSHSNILEIWPNSKLNKKIFKIKWK